MIRTSRLFFAAASFAVFASAVSPSYAVKPILKKTAKPAPPAAEGDKPLLVGTYGDWGAYKTVNGKTKVCYALGQPKERLPAGLQRDPAYLFVSRRTSEGVKNEISVGMGFPLKEGATAGSAEIGTLRYELVAKGDNAWVKNAAEEAPLLEAMKKGAKLVIKAASKKDHVTTDSYSLNGFDKAWERVLKDCP